jgi:ATP-dependent exoDNAse (exonuclease V) beta subunit
VDAAEVILDGMPNVPYCFEGGFRGNLYNSDGISLWDLYYLYTKKNDKIKHDIVKGIGDWSDMLEYTETVMDNDLASMMLLIKKYRSEAPIILRELKEKETTRDRAAMIFTTAHRSKGLEYDNVVLNSDFLAQEDIGEYLSELNNKDTPKENKAQIRNALTEELNILYVSVTRAKHEIDVKKVKLLNDYLKSKSGEAPEKAKLGKRKSADQMESDYEKEVQKLASSVSPR